MKKRLLIPCLLALLAFTATGQDRTFNLGFGFNPNIGWISGQDLKVDDNKDISTSGARMGMSYGLLFEYHFNENYIIASGIHHVFSGGKMAATLNQNPLPEPTATNTVQYYSVSYEPAKLRYIHIPALIRLRTNEIGYMRYFGNIGFAFDFALNGKTNVNYKGLRYVDENSTFEVIDREDENVRLQSRFFNTYFVVGLGGQYSLGGNTRVHLGVDYNAGLGNVLSKKEIEAYGNLFEDARLQNSYISLNLGIFL